MKNNTIKKSLKGLILLPISSLNGRFANDRPARKDPISMLNPSQFAIIINKKHKAMLLKNNNSCDFAIFVKRLDNTYLPNNFGLDKRIPHLSSMINSAQVTREQALKEIEKPLDSKINLPLPKLCLPKKDYKDYPNSEYWWNLLSKLYAKIK